MSSQNTCSSNRTPLEISRATQGDLDAIMAIERECFSPPWPRSAMMEEISGRDWSRVHVARTGEDIVGFMVYWIVDVERHLLNIATTITARRTGVGRAMMALLIDEATDNEAEAIILEVRRSNQGAQKLYDTLGFHSIGVRPGYYADNGEDAIVMILQPGEGKELP